MPYRNRPKAQLLFLFGMYLAGNAALVALSLWVRPHTFWGTLSMMSVSSIFIFLLPCAVLIKAYGYKSPIKTFGLNTYPRLSFYAWCALLLVCSLPLINFLTYANERIVDSLPIREAAQYASKKINLSLLSIFSKAKHSPILRGGAIVLEVGILTAIIEELFFRAVLQTLLQAMMRNRIKIILLSGLIFSALHFEFYGFMARWALGALLGYLYFCSSSIFPSMFIHALFNGTQSIRMLTLPSSEMEEALERPASLLLSEYRPLDAILIAASSLACFFIFRKLRSMSARGMRHI